MNCRALQDQLPEYLDETLSRREAQAVEEHLRACPACFEAVRQERQFAEQTSAQLQKRAALANMTPAFRHRLLQELSGSAAKMELRGDSPMNWIRLLWPATAAGAGLLLLALFWREPSLRQPSSTPARGSSFSVEVVCAMPIYTSRQDGDRVVDSLSYRTILVDQPAASRN